MGAVRNRFLVFHGFHGTVISMAYDMRTVADRNGTVQMLVNGDGLTSQGVAPTGLVELPPPTTDGNRVVFGHNAFGLNREDPVQIAAGAGAEGRAARRLCW